MSQSRDEKKEDKPQVRRPSPSPAADILRESIAALTHMATGGAFVPQTPVLVRQRPASGSVPSTPPNGFSENILSGLEQSNDEAMESAPAGATDSDPDNVVIRDNELDDDDYQDGHYRLSTEDIDMCSCDANNCPHATRAPMLSEASGSGHASAAAENSAESEPNDSSEVTHTAVVTSAPAQPPSNQPPNNEEPIRLGLNLRRVLRQWKKTEHGCDIYQQKRMANGEWVDMVPTPFTHLHNQPETASYLTWVCNTNTRGHELVNTLEIAANTMRACPMIQVLREVGVETPISCESQGLLPSVCFVEPFVELYYRYDWIQDYHLNPDEQKLAADPLYRHKLDCAEFLDEFLSEMFAPTGERFDIVRSQLVPKEFLYEELWMVYRPGTIVYVLEPGKPPIALKVRYVRYSKLEVDFVRQLAPSEPGVLEIHLYGFDNYVPHGTTRVMMAHRDYIHIIPPFEDGVSPTQLKCIPEEFVQDEGYLRMTLAERGRKFWGLRGPKHMEADRLDPSWVPTERIMVDPATSDEGEHFPGLSEIIPRLHEDLRRMTTETAPNDPSYQPSDEELMLCPPIIRGFSLSHNIWTSYHVSSLREIVFHDDKWNWVMNDVFKDGILSAVVSFPDQSDDSEGDERGLNCFVWGSCGTSKTFTIMALAEKVKRPLLVKHAEQLMLEGGHFAGRLAMLYARARRWKAILLLEDVDHLVDDLSDDPTNHSVRSIFNHSIQRNKGIMFLTSNPVKQPDPYFMSRLTWTFEFKPLNRDARFVVWQKAIDSVEDEMTINGSPLVNSGALVLLENAAIRKWAPLPLNAHQIVNCVEAAMRLAQGKNEMMAENHVETAMEGIEWTPEM